MKVEIDKLLVNRSEITRFACIAGIPVIQMPTHVPFVESVLNGSDPPFETSYYSSMCINTPHAKGGYQNTPEFKSLMDSIKANGVKNPVTGWDLGTCYEICGGHHRAIIDRIVNNATHIELEPMSFDVYSKMSEEQLNKIRNVYQEVSNKEITLPRGRCYNSFPGLVAFRRSMTRLIMIYRDIISCRGNRLGDIGCNDGYFGTSLYLHDFNPVFIDRSIPYLNVVSAKMEALGRPNYPVLHKDIETMHEKDHFYFDVSLFLDVFYHMVLEKGKSVGLKQLEYIISRTKERLIFSPGRWDKLYNAGCTQKDVFDVIEKRARQIRYLGKDSDKGYGREIYSIYY